MPCVYPIQSSLLQASALDRCGVLHRLERHQRLRASQHSATKRRDIECLDELQ